MQALESVRERTAYVGDDSLSAVRAVTGVAVPVSTLVGWIFGMFFG